MTTPKPEIGKLLTEACQYWMRTLPFQFLFTVIYFAVLMFAGAYAFRYYGLFEEVNKFSGLMYTDYKSFFNKYAALMMTPNGMSFMMVLLAIKAVVFPLNIGFFKVYRKLDLGEKPEMNDLFAGFQGHYFFLFVIYSLFWSVFYNALSLVPIIGNLLIFVWIMMMLFVPALVFYKGFNFSKAFQISIQTFQKNFILIFVASFVSVLFSYCGFIMFFFGIFLTFPFWNAMIYVLYKHLIVDFEE